VMRAGGRLLIADFVPHQVEFLREEYAHRRLGFSDKEIHGWLEAAGLEPLVGENIVPRFDAEEKLIVKIWLARKASNADEKVAAA
jgi:hypothetical protein